MWTVSYLCPKEAESWKIPQQIPPVWSCGRQGTAKLAQVSLSILSRHPTGEEGSRPIAILKPTNMAVVFLQESVLPDEATEQDKAKLWDLYVFPGGLHTRFPRILLVSLLLLREGLTMVADAGRFQRTLWQFCSYEPSNPGELG